MKKILIDTAYKKVLTQHNENTYTFWFSYQNKKELIRTLKEQNRNLKADGRTSYSLIEERYNKGVNQ